MIENNGLMFNSPIEFFQFHYGEPGDIEVVFSAAIATNEAIIAFENGNKDLARQKWKSVDGDKLIHLWNVGITNCKLRGKKWADSEKPEFDGPIAKQVSESLAKKVYLRDDCICRYCDMPVFTRFRRSRIHQLIEAFPELTPGLHLDNGSLKGSGKNGAIKNVDYAKFLWSMAAPDHVIPRSHGGLTDMGNLVTSCSGCNYSKGDLTLEQMGVQWPKPLL